MRPLPLQLKRPMLPTTTGERGARRLGARRTEGCQMDLVAAIEGASWRRLSGIHPAFMWWGVRDSNPHSGEPEGEFKSPVSTIPPTPRELAPSA